MSIKVSKALICDDSVLIRKKLKDVLIKFGCSEVFEAADGENAVNMYKENIPDLVFMDIVMPVKDGIEAVTEILQFDPKAQVIMASSSGTKTHLKKALEAGACDFLQKPVTEETVRKILVNFHKEA